MAEERITRDGFIFYRSFFEAIRELPRDIQGEVLTAIIEYGLDGVTTENLKPVAKAMFTLVKPQLDANNKKFLNGKKGGRKPNDNQTGTKQKPNNNLNITKSEPKEKENVKEKDNVEYKYSFVKITDFADTLKNFSLNKSYLFIAYRFWQLWWKDNQTKTLRDAIVINWYNSIRMIIENDKQSIERLLVVYFYFERCQQQEAGFDTFWFENIKSVSAFRKKDRDGVYYLDKIMEKINSKLAKDEDFDRFISKKIKEFKEYEIAKLHKKQS